MWFARQYADFKASDRKWRNGEYDRIKTGNAPGRGHSDPTANEAMRRACSPFAWKIGAIERAAIAAAPDFCAELLKNVTADLSWEVVGPPCCRKVFYAARRKFFLELHNILENG